VDYPSRHLLLLEAAQSAKSFFSNWLTYPLELRISICTTYAEGHVLQTAVMFPSFDEDRRNKLAENTPIIIPSICYYFYVM
jgi:hypothetical protein